MNKQFRASGQTAMHACACGRFHFTYGPLTLHFEPREFLLFATDVSRLASLLKNGKEWESLTDSQDAKVSCH